MAAMRCATLALLILLIFCGQTLADDSIKLPDLSPAQSALEQANVTLNFNELIMDLLGGKGIGFDQILSSAKAAVADQLGFVFATIAKLFVPATLLFILIELMGGEKKRRAASEFACYLFTALALLDIYRSAVLELENFLRDVGRFIESLFPILSALLVSCGASLTAATHAPLMGIAAGLLSGVIGSAAMQLCALGLVSAIFGSISERFSLGKLLGLSRSILNWLLALSLTGFSGLIAAQNLITNARDSAAMRASRYAAKNLIPGVGSEVADAMYAAVGSAVVVKNTAGAAGLIALLLLCVAPLVRLMLCLFATRAAAALIEPLGSSCVSKLVERCAVVFSMLLMAGCAMALVCIVLIGAVLGAGNAALTLS